MRITINQSELHDAIFHYYDVMDDVPPAPLPDTPEHLDEIMMIVDGSDPVVESTDHDGCITLLSFTPRYAPVEDRIAMRARAKKTNAQYDKAKRSAAALKAWETKRCKQD